MLRPRRCHLTALLWLALALLPLRGWAQAVMAVQAPAPTLATAPCHGHADGGSPAATPSSHASCHLCDLCHNALATPQQAPAAPCTAPGGAPGAARTPALAMAEPAGIFRPPRP